MRGFISVPLDDLLEPALNISMETRASIYDSLYLALALSEDCQLVSDDRRLIAKMAGTSHARLLVALDSVIAAP